MINMDQELRLRNPASYMQGNETGYPNMSYAAPPTNYPNYSFDAEKGSYPTHDYPTPSVFGQPPPNRYPIIPQSQQPSAAPFIDNNITNSMMMNFGVQYGHKMLQKTQDNFSRYFFSLQGVRYYFTVNNNYVKNKLKLLIFPFNHKFRRRESDLGSFDHGSQSNYCYFPAIDDINAPDMYIPLMSFITYVLLVGFFTGIGGENFSPEVLLSTGSSCLVLLFLEIFILKIGCYILSTLRPVFTLDILCWSSYKYFIVSLCLLLRSIVSFIYSPIWICLSLAHGFFLFKTLQLHWADSTAHAQDIFLYAVAAVQVPLFYWLLRV